MSDPSLALKVYDRASVSENVFKPVLISEKDPGFTEPIINSSLLFKKRYLFLKRVADITISLTVITLLLWWLLPLLALMIKIDSRGPVLFIQKRNKKQGGVFNCIKLRTMTVSDTHIHITRLGKFLRKSHLDELPQFINVLRGDMSVVGPRPHMLAENIKYNKVSSFYDDRHFVKPRHHRPCPVLWVSRPRYQSTTLK